MNLNGSLQILLYLVVLIAITKPIGNFMAKVFEGEATFLHPILRPFERLIYRLCGIREEDDMPWTTYAVAMLLFSAVGMFITYGLLRTQGIFSVFGWNPQGLNGTNMTPDLALNTAASFTTNTNWQAYTPETTVSYFSNMVALATHNWMSAATGIAIAIALIRGFARRSSKGIGNFWVDIIRSTIYVLLPISLIGGIIFIAGGVPQNFLPYQIVTTLEGAKQAIAQGPVASQEIIKMLGTNGGGFFNANSAHPYENPSNLINLLQIIAIFVIPAGLTYTFGKMVGNVRQGWAVFGAMAIMFLTGAFVCNVAEQAGNPFFAKAGVMTTQTATQPGGNMEGKETRFGIGASSLFATITTDASCGAVNSMHDSYTPLGGLVPLFNILTGEVIFGGVGAGLYGMLMFAIIGVFIAGLMVGRTPEYIGKKIEKFEVQMSMLVVLILAASILGFTALSANTTYPPGDTAQTFDDKHSADEAKLPAMASWNHQNGSSPSNYYGATTNNLNNSGAHGFSEILYMYASSTGNNGSAFAGITSNTPHYNVTGTLAMLIGRFLMIVPLLAIAGSLAAKKKVPESAGTFATDSGTFVALLVGVVILVNALTFFPALALGPIVEHFQMTQMKKPI
ncbi:MAG: potassium-transporting ATPase subunit KdpA [Fimbriimonas sp.]|nr:potassium-transporting ATPase subunit KdpA [Fimbriimonas sp.]